MKLLQKLNCIVYQKTQTEKKNIQAVQVDTDPQILSSQIFEIATSNARTTYAHTKQSSHSQTSRPVCSYFTYRKVIAIETRPCLARVQFPLQSHPYLYSLPSINSPSDQFMHLESLIRITFQPLLRVDHSVFVQLFTLCNRFFFGKAKVSTITAYIQKSYRTVIIFNASTVCIGTGSVMQYRVIECKMTHRLIFIYSSACYTCRHDLI